MDFLAGLLAKAAVRWFLAGLLITALGGGYAWAHHKGALAQAAKDKRIISALTIQRDHWRDQVAADALTLAAVDDATALAQATAAAEKRRAAAAVKRLQATAAANAKVASTWHARWSSAVQTDACKIAREPICPALRDY